MSALMDLRDSISRTFRKPTLWAVQLLANPALFGLFAIWLLIPVARSWQLALNVLIGLVFLTGVLVLHGGTMMFYRAENDPAESRLGPAFQSAVCNIVPLLLCGAAIYFCWTLLDKLDAYQDIFPNYLRSMLPAFVRAHVTLASLTFLYRVIIFVVRWIAMPGVLLPLFLRSAQLGFRAFSKSSLSSWGKSLWSLSYWSALALATVIGVLGPAWLMDAKPDFRSSTYTWEMSSLIVRLTIAYLLGIAAWLLTCSVVSRRAGSSDVGRIGGAANAGA